MNTEKIILSFDLDNTLINNREGIVDSFNYALHQFDLPLMNKDDIEKMIGIPLHQMFSKIAKTNVEELVISFREYYGNKGIYQGHLIPGVKKKLHELNKARFIMGVISSKKQEMAEKMVEILKIRKYLDYVLGETDDRKDLGKLDPSFKIFFQKKYPNYKVIIIGDHPKDVMLSNNLDCPFIGVLTGNHSAQELSDLKKGEHLILNSVKEIDLSKIYRLFQGVL